MTDAFPSYFRKSQLKNEISPNSSKDSTKIGESETEKITICSEYKNEGVLRMYMNREHRELIEGIRFSHFKKFVHKHINYPQIIRFIVELVRGLSNAVEEKTSVSECMRLLNKEIDDFNKDLQQISSELSYRFKSDLHDLCLHLLWKWHE